MIVVELTIRLELEPEEVWPDNNIPGDFSADDVVVAVEKSGTVSRFIKNWGADAAGAEVAIHAKGKYARGWLR
jgi:hypothetical protein